MDRQARWVPVYLGHRRGLGAALLLRVGVVRLQSSAVDVVQEVVARLRERAETLQEEAEVVAYHLWPEEPQQVVPV